VESASVEQPEGLDARARARIYGVGAILALLLGALAPAPWLLALLVIGVLSATWMSSFVPPARG
jgi:hypothetical protein